MNSLFRFSTFWDILVCAIATLMAFVIPAHLTLHQFAWPLIVLLEIGTTVLFGIDAIRHRKDTHPVFWFVVDVISAIPFLFITLSPVWLLFRVLKLARVIQFSRDWLQGEILNIGYLRLGLFAYCVAVATHWLACGWLGIHPDYADSGSMERYVSALYWTVQTLSTVGYGDITPDGVLSRVYAIVVMLFGVAIYGYVIGNVAGILANMDPARTQHVERMRQMSAFMRHSKVPQELRARIRDYYTYIWKHKHALDEAAIISSLSPGLQTEMSMFLRREIIEKVPLFRDGSESFLKEMAMHMEPVVYLPGDVVLRAGDRAKEMFFVSKGSLEVKSADGTRMLNTLVEGDFFGEIALFQNTVRTASVIAQTSCDLYRLGKTDFENVVSHYPDIGSKIEAAAKERKERG